MQKRPVLVQDAVLRRERIDGGDVGLVELYVAVVDVGLARGRQVARLQRRGHQGVAARVDRRQRVERGRVDGRQCGERGGQRRHLRQRGEVRRRRRRELRELRDVAGAGAGRGARRHRHGRHAGQPRLRDHRRLRERLELALEGRQLVGDRLQGHRLVGLQRGGEAGAEDGVLAADGDRHGLPGPVLRLAGDDAERVAGALVVLPGGLQQARVGVQQTLLLRHVSEGGEGRQVARARQPLAHGASWRRERIAPDLITRTRYTVRNSSVACVQK